MNLLLLILVVTLGFVATEEEPGAIELLDHRIVGGRNASICDYPYQASVQYLGRHICGGVIIGPKWVITTARCLVRFDVRDLKVRVGSSYWAFGGQLINIRKTYIHLMYNVSGLDYDIGLTELDGEIKVPCARPVTLPNPNTPIFPGSNGVVTGWGRTIEGGSLSSQLQVLYPFPILSPQVCCRAYGCPPFTERMVCAGIIEGGKGVCHGDSGSPLVVNKVLIGLVSWGYGCARPNYPGVFTNVAAFISDFAKISGIQIEPKHE